MEIFRLVKTHLTNLGLGQIQLMQPYPFLNRKLLVTSLIMSLNMVLCCLHFLFVASSFEEYIDSFFTSSGSVGVFVIFSTYVWKIKILYQKVDQLQEIVNASE